VAEALREAGGDGECAENVREKGEHSEVGHNLAEPEQAGEGQPAAVRNGEDVAQPSLPLGLLVQIGQLCVPLHMFAKDGQRFVGAPIADEPAR
jgi:hypothetical protein